MNRFKIKRTNKDVFFANSNIYIASIVGNLINRKQFIEFGGFDTDSITTDFYFLWILVENIKSILEYQLKALKEQGLNEIILIVGHLGERIKEYFGDGSKNSKATGEPFSVSITYITETEPLGTAGALYLLKGVLEDGFLLINGDIILDIVILRFLFFIRKMGNGDTFYSSQQSSLRQWNYCRQ